MSDAPDRAATAVAQWRREQPGHDYAPMEALGRLAELALVVSRDRLGPIFARHDLQPGEFDVLAALRRAGEPYELTPTALFGITMLSSGGLTARLDRLEAKGLVARRANPADRRGTLVTLTPEGRARIEAALPEHLAEQTRIASALTSDELAELSRLLAKVLERADPDPEP